MKMKIKTLTLTLISLLLTCAIIVSTIYMNRLLSQLRDLESIKTENHKDKDLNEIYTQAEGYAKQKLYKNIFMLIPISVILLLLLLALFIILNDKLFLQLNKLIRLSAKATEGDLDVHKQISEDLKGKDEIGELGQSVSQLINQLSTVRHSLKSRQKQLDSELNIAKDIQMSMIPLTFPPYPDRAEFDLFAKLFPALQVGGDFYDFYFLDQDHLCFVIGDVSGKGVPAALLMAVCRTLLKARAQDDLSPASIITHINGEISKENPNCMFITIFLATLNINTGHLIYTNAGHNPTMLRTKDREVRFLEDIHGPAVGAMEGFAYESSSLNLKTGESLILYTDGVTEAHNPDNEMYSEERFTNFIKNHDFSSAKKVMEDLFTELKNFEQDRPPFDDTTALCLKYLKGSMTAQYTKSITIPNKLEEINTIIAQFEVFAEKYEMPTPVTMKINLALDDVLGNIMQYAYPDGGEHEITCEFHVYSDHILINISDDGLPFNPLLTAPPDTNLALEDRIIGGLGIHLVKSIMDDCHYRRKINQNILTLTKNFKASSHT